MTAQLLDKISFFKKIAQNPAALTDQITNAIKGALTPFQGQVQLDPNFTTRVLPDSKVISIRVMVPERHPQDLGKVISQTLTQSVQSVAPGFRVEPIFTFMPTPAKRAQDTGAATKQIIVNELAQIPGTQLVSFSMAPENKQITIEVRVPADKKFTAQQLGNHLTGKIQTAAAGFTVIPTLSF